MEEEARFVLDAGDLEVVLVVDFFDDDALPVDFLLAVEEERAAFLGEGEAAATDFLGEAEDLRLVSVVVVAVVRGTTVEVFATAAEERAAAAVARILFLSLARVFPPPTSLSSTNDFVVSSLYQPKM